MDENFWMKTKNGGKVKMGYFLEKTVEELREIQETTLKARLERAKNDWEDSQENRYINFLIKKLNHQ